MGHSANPLLGILTDRKQAIQAIFGQGWEQLSLSSTQAMQTQIRPQTRLESKQH